jgi:magnesium transporter
VTQRLLNVLSPSDLREASWLLGIFRGGFEIGSVVGLTMALMVMLIDLLGAALPDLLTRLSPDPAVASSP